jgi:hypothetical protein
MYHTHFNDMRQQYGGLVGPLVVLEPGDQWDAQRELLLMIRDSSHASIVIDRSAPGPAELHVGTTYRIRLADIAIYRQNLLARVVRDSSLVTWRAIAKDGFTLPPQQATIRRSISPLASGETADFELTPDTEGKLTLEVGTSDRGGVFRTQASFPLHVVAK